MVSGLVTARLVEGEFYSAPGDPRVAGADPVPADGGDGTHGGGQSDSEADRERKHQAGAGGEWGVGAQWATDASCSGGGGNGYGEASRAGAGEVKEQKGRVTAGVGRVFNPPTALGAYGIAHAGGGTGGCVDSR